MPDEAWPWNIEVRWRLLAFARNLASEERVVRGLLVFLSFCLVFFTYIEYVIVYIIIMA